MILSLDKPITLQKGQNSNLSLVSSLLLKFQTQTQTQERSEMLTRETCWLETFVNFCTLSTGSTILHPPLGSALVFRLQKMTCKENIPEVTDQELKLV